MKVAQELSHFTGNPLISALPPIVRFDARKGSEAGWMRSSLEFAADEIAARRAGSETVPAKLSELLFVEALRRYVEGLPDEKTGWLAGLKDPFVSRALSLLHRRVARQWTVDDLGRDIGLSRSALADRFTRLIGEPPMRWHAGGSSWQLITCVAATCRLRAWPRKWVTNRGLPSTGPSSAALVSRQPPGARTRPQ